jgi:hypothetical protein
MGPISQSDFLICLAAGDFGVLADFDWGKGEMVKQKRGMDTLTGERGKGKAERVVHSCLLVFHFSTNHEIRPVFMFFTG